MIVIGLAAEPKNYGTDEWPTVFTDSCTATKTNDRGEFQFVADKNYTYFRYKEAGVFDELESEKVYAGVILWNESQDNTIVAIELRFVYEDGWLKSTPLDLRVIAPFFLEYSIIDLGIFIPHIKVDEIDLTGISGGLEGIVKCLLENMINDGDDLGDESIL